MFGYETMLQPQSHRGQGKSQLLNKHSRPFKSVHPSKPSASAISSRIPSPRVSASHLRQDHLPSTTRFLFWLLFLGRAILQKDLPGGGSAQPKKGLPKVKVTRVPETRHRPLGVHTSVSGVFHRSGVTFGKPHFPVPPSHHCKTGGLGLLRALEVR